MERRLIVCIPRRVSVLMLGEEDGQFIDWYILEVDLTLDGVNHRMLDIKLFKGTHSQACYLAFILVKAHDLAFSKGDYNA